MRGASLRGAGIGGSACHRSVPADPVMQSTQVPVDSVLTRPGVSNLPDRLTNNQFRVLATLALFLRLQKAAEATHYQLMKFENERMASGDQPIHGDELALVYYRAGAGGNSDGQWHKTLQTLVDLGMLTRHSAAGGRKRFFYRITDVGLTAANEWMHEAESLLKMGMKAFGDPASSSKGEKVLVELKK